MFQTTNQPWYPIDEPLTKHFWDDTGWHWTTGNDTAAFLAMPSHWDGGPCLLFGVLSSPVQNQCWDPLRCIHQLSLQDAISAPNKLQAEHTHHTDPANVDAWLGTGQGMGSRPQSSAFLRHVETNYMIMPSECFGHHPGPISHFSHYTCFILVGASVTVTAITAC